MGHHVSRRRVYGALQPCYVPDCRNFPIARGLCMGHYAQLRRGERFRKVSPDADSCKSTDVARVDAEIASGIRCRCAMLMPCNRCVPALVEFAETRGDFE